MPGVPGAPGLPGAPVSPWKYQPQDQMQETEPGSFVTKTIVCSEIWLVGGNQTPSHYQNPYYD